ncbi:toxin-antitoxin system, toxin component, HicA family protein [Prochlorothrix hollandica]|nr:toxin-antitoxin system, toxin component, HicA family protein [Prochlorothrix hollandica]
MGRVVRPRRGRTTPRVSAIEMPTTDLGLLYKAYMSKIEKLLSKLENDPKSVTFRELCQICDHYFGKPRMEGTSHRVYKTPWPGDPRVNIQQGSKKKNHAKLYQVKQVLRAVQKLKNLEDLNELE